METELIHVEIQQKVAILTIDNPPANALSPKLREEFLIKMDKIAEDDAVWSLIITGEGEKFFAAGADIPSLLKLDYHSGLKRVQESRRFYSGVACFPKPVIAAINGICFGGGLELALSCDMRIAADHVKIGAPEVNLGIIPGAGGTQRLPRTVGPGWANYIMFTGEPLVAEKALQIGLIQDMVDLSSLKDRAIEIAEKINMKGPLAVRMVKEVVLKGLSVSLEEGLDIENEGFAKICSTQDKNEGISAFLEKRKPAFKGK